MIGANGAGKSTLLMLLLGVLFPTGGEVRIGGAAVTEKSLAEVRRRLGMVFQNPDDQLFMPTVYDDVAFGPRNYRLDEKEVDRRVQNALDVMGIAPLSEKAPFKLSGGEKRSAAIASVLSMEPDVLVMDEPTAGLDPKSRRRVIRFLNQYGHTKMITSHDLDLIADTCRRVLLIQNGIIAADGPASSILTDEALLDACGLELPPSIRSCPVCGRSKQAAHTAASSGDQPLP